MVRRAPVAHAMPFASEDDYRNCEGLAMDASGKPLFLSGEKLSMPLLEVRVRRGM